MPDSCHVTPTRSAADCDAAGAADATAALGEAAGAIVADSEHSRREIVTRLGLPAERITVIPSSVDVPLLQTRAAEPLPAWAVPVFAKPTLLSVGRLVPSKGFDVLLHAHARVRRDGIGSHGGRTERHAGRGAGWSGPGRPDRRDLGLRID
jgi:glycosyltransferase involved in cell wall biosynthesis